MVREGNPRMESKLGPLRLTGQLEDRLIKGDWKERQVEEEKKQESVLQVEEHA